MAGSLSQLNHDSGLDGFRDKSISNHSQNHQSYTSDSVGSKCVHQVIGIMESMTADGSTSTKKLQSIGYTRAVDFYCLGIMIYKLLTGLEPHKSLTHAELKKMMPTQLMKFTNYHDAYIACFGSVDYAVCNGILNEHTRSLLQGLLQFRAQYRLGYNATNLQAGFDSLMGHPFFEDIDWTAIICKQVNPPYIPQQEIISTIKDDVIIPKTLREILVEADKCHWCEEFSPTSLFQRMKIDPDDQKYFRKWNYASKL